MKWHLGWHYHVLTMIQCPLPREESVLDNPLIIGAGASLDSVIAGHIVSYLEVMALRHADQRKQVQS